MKLHAFYKDQRLILQQRAYIEEGWQIRYDEAKPSGRWEVVEVPLCAEDRLYKCCESLEDALAATEELT